MSGQFFVMPLNSVVREEFELIIGPLPISESRLITTEELIAVLKSYQDCNISYSFYYSLRDKQLNFGAEIYEITVASYWESKNYAIFHTMYEKDEDRVSVIIYSRSSTLEMMISITERIARVCGAQIFFSDNDMSCYTVVSAGIDPQAIADEYAAKHNIVRNY